MGLKTLVKNRTAQSTGKAASWETMRATLPLLRDKGDTRDIQLARSRLLTCEEKGDDDDPVIGRHGAKVYCGDPFALEDCASQEFRPINLLFYVLDYGGTIKLSDSLRRALGTGHEAEVNHRASMAISAGIEWVAQGRPKRYPAKREWEVTTSNGEKSIEPQRRGRYHQQESIPPAQMKYEVSHMNR